MNLLIIKNPDKFWLKIAKELTDLKKSYMGWYL